MAEKNDDLLQRARDRFKHAGEVDGDNRKREREAIKFVWVKGAQWPDNIKQIRGDAQPCLEINQLPQFIKQVVNDQRQSRPGIRVHPAGVGATVETAKLLQGIVRHIEYDSQAEAAYDSAFELAVTGGRGYWRILTEYEDEETFNQKLVIRRIADNASVFIDPDFQQPDASDINWAFIVETMTLEQFRKQYPKADEMSFNFDGSDQWMVDDEHILVADYYERESTKRTLVAVSDGDSTITAWKDELPKDMPPTAVIEREREVDTWSVRWYKIAGGQQVLEEHDWVEEHIPVICCIGDEIWVDGKRIVQGLIERAMDTQRMYNYAASATAERIALVPKAPYIMAEGQDEGYEGMWRNANKVPYPALVYKPVTIAGTLAPPPQRSGTIQAETGLIELQNQAKADLRATIGIYDPSLGQRSNETSGRAILAREKQGDTATFHFFDNLSRAIGFTGRIIVNAIPKVYDRERSMRIVNPDDTQAVVTINQRTVNLGEGGVQEQVQNDITVGKYTVTVEAGPSYSTKRQETAESLMGFVQAFPAAAQVAGDLIAKSMDWADADIIAERLKFLLPPAIQQMEEAKKNADQSGEKVDPQVLMLRNQIEALKKQAMDTVQKAQQMAQEAGQNMQKLQMENEGLKVQLKDKLSNDAIKIMVDSIANDREALKNERVAFELEVKELTAKLEDMMLQEPPENVEEGQAQQAAQSDVIARLENSMQSLQAILGMPRKLQVVRDDAGNVVGGVSAPAPGGVQ